MTENVNNPRIVSMPLEAFEQIKAAVDGGLAELQNVINSGVRSTCVYETQARLSYAMVNISRVNTDESQVTKALVPMTTATIEPIAKKKKKTVSSSNQSRAAMVKAHMPLSDRAVSVQAIPDGYVMIKELAKQMHRDAGSIAHALRKKDFSAVVRIDKSPHHLQPLFVNVEKALVTLAA